MGFEQWLARGFFAGISSGGRAVVEEGLKSLNDQDLDTVKKLILKIQEERKKNVIEVEGETQSK